MTHLVRILNEFHIKVCKYKYKVFVPQWTRKLCFLLLRYRNPIRVLQAFPVFDRAMGISRTVRRTHRVKETIPFWSFSSDSEDQFPSPEALAIGECLPLDPWSPTSP